MNNKKAFTPMILIFVVVAIAALLFLLYVNIFVIKVDTQTESNVTEMESTATPPSQEEPVSDSTEIEVMEQELDQIITGSPADELDAMESDASSL